MQPTESPRTPITRFMVCCGLLLALSACSSKRGDEASQVVATVNKSEISVHQINQMLQRQPVAASAPGASIERQVLDRLIEQEIAVQRALDMKLDRDPEVMQNIAAARREVLARAYGAKVAATVAPPQPKDLQDFFDARPALFSQRKVYALQEFAVQADKTQVQALGQFVGKAKNLTELTDYLRTQQLAVRTNQSTQPAENLPEALLQRLDAMKAGQLLLLAAPGGARIIVLAGSRPAPVTLAQVQSAIEQALTGERRRLAVQADLDTARKASHIQYHGLFADAVPTTDNAAGSAQPLSTAPAAHGAKAAAPSQTPVTAAPALADDAAMLSKGLAGLK